MKIAEFIDRLAERLDVSRDEAHRIYRTFIATTKDALSRGEEVRLETLGKLVSTLGSVSQGRPHRADKRVVQMMTVQFEQFRSSRTELVALSPFAKELTSGGFFAEQGSPEEGRADGRSSVVGDESDADE